ncbi:phenylalanine--tRNA ligase subunit beta [Microbacterium sp. STN6]|uniref:phenylalanine--tRNA ligase subunit beta n=1 Tax=Microbacterium sp. STN6 TaxID=2995588 RepID=UPI002260FE9E|nr:phenylalanine--tRNA ligase subunit beta [Microbacterium sp. STN6]MCX7521333.1 phenylalanine--tRNA ligase subunit beta [Microbacterium sp. STN6]
MRVPLSWLAEFVDLQPGTTPEQVHAALVRVGLEEEEIHRFEVSGPVVVGQVLDFVEEPQKNGKTIRWCQVQVAPEGERAADGGDAVHGIVCGAHNFLVGDKVVVTLPGAVLPGPFPIAARKTYGHVSDGMIASVRELGLGDDHEGILRLSTLGLDPEVGADAIALLGLDDSAVEINVTPDRGYAFSIRGVAREYAHSTGAVFRDPALTRAPEPAAERVEEREARLETRTPAEERVEEREARLETRTPAEERVEEREARLETHIPALHVTLDDTAPIRGRQGATVFVTRVVRDVDPARPTPPWMTSRLTLAGIRSRALIVDVTNYVMLELGQPIHAYDLDRLTGDITVRRAQPGETLVTLDDATRELNGEDLVIADASGAIGLAGVMGGASTEIGADTRNVLIEAANFDPVSIARTARRHKLPSEASKRFERGVDPRVAEAAAARVVQLLETLAGGRADARGSVIDESTPRHPIDLVRGYVSSLIGVDYTDDEIRGSLSEIGAELEVTETGLAVTPPSWRPDLAAPCDLAEEVARIVGYDRIPSVLPVAPPGRGLSRSQQLRRQASAALADAGLTEVLAYPFVDANANDTFGSPVGESVRAMRLANPLDASAPFLRVSLLPGLLDVARRNLSRGFTDLAVYEAGLVFLPQDGVQYGSSALPVGAALPAADTLAALNAGIPPQPRRIAAVLLGNTVDRQPEQPPVPVGVADAIAVARQVGHAIGATIDVVQGSHGALHPGRTAELVVNGAERAHHVGYAGELLPALAAELDLPRVVAVVELDLDLLIHLASSHVEARQIADYPAATQDLSLVVPISAAAGDVHTAVVQGAGPLLEDARLVDDYRGSGVPEGAKSLTFALRFRASDRTLTAAEASGAKLAGAALAAERYGATIRE